MRRCCCCIPVLPGAVVLGITGILIGCGALAILIPFLVNWDVFNPIGNNVNEMLYILETHLEENEFSKEEIIAFKDYFKQYLQISCLVDACVNGVYALLALLMVIGVGCDMRGLMIPYLMFQMLLIVICVLAGLGLTVVLFFYNTTIGVVSTVVVLNVAFLLVYFWVAVQKAFVELGSRDYMYSPAPTKPHFENGSYPSAPQHFQMQEHHSGK